MIVYDGEEFSNLMLTGAPYGLCGASLAPRYRQIDSSGNALTVRFITDNVVSANKGFSLVFTSYVPEETNGKAGTCWQGAGLERWARALDLEVGGASIDRRAEPCIVERRAGLVLEEGRG